MVDIRVSILVQDNQTRLRLFLPLQDALHWVVIFYRQLEQENLPAQPRDVLSYLQMDIGGDDAAFQALLQDFQDSTHKVHLDHQEQFQGY
jgi:hypothetical protein